MSELDSTDLVCKARREALTDEEERRLEGLLRTSFEARLMSSVQREFERESQVRRGDDALITRMVTRATGQLGPPAPRRMAALLAAVAVALLAAVAGAWRATRPAPLRSPAGMAAPRPSASAAKVLRIAPSSADAHTAGEDRDPQLHRGSETARPAGASVVELFARANLLRREGRNQEAVRVYQTIVQGFPAAREAAPARLALAKLLAASNPRQALMHYEALAAGDGPLRAEALWGVAESGRRLGQTAVEQRALSELLRSFPDSPYAEVARGRLPDAGR